VVVPTPDEAGRRAILAVHMRATPLQEGLARPEACARLALATAGFSGAELANVVNEATLLAARRGQDDVGMRELLEGVQRTRFGVDGRGGGAAGGLRLPAGVQKWMMDMAVGDSGRQVKVSGA
jgi:cell division protease FtsH